MINSPPPVSASRVISREPHRKRLSRRFSSDKSVALPEYTPHRTSTTTTHSWSPQSIPSDLPPEYPDSADEADEETDDYVPLSPPLSPRRHRRHRSLVSTRQDLYSGFASVSDTHLDSALNRSAHMLAVSQAALHSSTIPQSRRTSSFRYDSGTDDILDTRLEVLKAKMRHERDNYERWIDDLNSIAKGVEGLTGDAQTRKVEDSTMSRSLPSGSQVPSRKSRRRPSLEIRETVSDVSRLHMSSERRSHMSPPPRALTQHVSIESAAGSAHEYTADSTSIFMPSTIGLRSPPHLSDFNPNSRSTSTSQTSHGNFASFVEHATTSRSPSPASSKRYSRSITPRAGERQRPHPQRRRSQSSSRSWSSNSNPPPSPSSTHRPMPPPIEELTSPSDSSASSDGPQVFRTVESLRKILDEQHIPTDCKGKSPIKDNHAHPQSFQPRSPPVAPVVGTTSTTTSISRLLTKGSHSTSARARSPPRHSSLKNRLAGTPATLSIPDSDPNSSHPSSGRSTPRQVAFGPLPESYTTSKGGSSPKFREKSLKKTRSKDRERKRDSGSDTSWWTAWLTGGSNLTTSPARHEERMEERVARSMGRPGMSGVEEWAV
ncbi:hypothetical protein BD410DRAFT_892675 [Rickenella mellea]|uniref:Uncharacterized protein n=1 Tax=Rickenella mellea TaxID=50990 RepID=A0A4R5XE39_9AGAM|nr:hypothetical protein BD410DRAFT_892675 [Rickenella mellea]